MPNIATWWCGQPAERERVLAALETMSVAGAFDDAVPGFDGPRSVVGGELVARERAAACARRSTTRGVDYVGQDIVRLSTTPRWEHGRLVPRPFVLRVYAAATPEGWRVMPGGFCPRFRQDRRARRLDGRRRRIGRRLGAGATARSRRRACCRRPKRVRIVRMLGNLPSRAADNLFWFGRYLEREEATLRLVRCLCSRAVDPDAPIARRAPIARAAEDAARRLGRDPRRPGRCDFGAGGRDGAARSVESTARRFPSPAPRATPPRSFASA